MISATTYQIAKLASARQLGVANACKSGLWGKVVMAHPSYNGFTYGRRKHG